MIASGRTSRKRIPSHVEIILQSKNYEDYFPEDFHDDASIRIDEYDMGAFRDFIAIILLS
jgi:hypothetical protein